MFRFATEGKEKRRKFSESKGGLLSGRIGGGKKKGGCTLKKREGDAK